MREDGYEQRIVMLAANVLSIADVLDTIKDGKSHNYYSKYDFHYKVVFPPSKIY